MAGRPHRPRRSLTAADDDAAAAAAAAGDDDPMYITICPVDLSLALPTHPSQLQRLSWFRDSGGSAGGSATSAISAALCRSLVASRHLLASIYLLQRLACLGVEAWSADQVLEWVALADLPADSVHYTDDDSGMLVPRILVCGHTLCHGCVTTLLTHVKVSGGKKKLRCPSSCDQVTRVPSGEASQLPKNYSLI